MLTDHRAMPHHLIGRFYRLQRVTGMPHLPSRLLLASFAQADPLSPQPITRRGLAAIMAILGQLFFDLPQPPQHFLQHLSQLGVLHSFPRQFSLESDCLRSLCGQFLLQLCEFFFCRHALSLAALATLPVELQITYIKCSILLRAGYCILCT